MATLSEDLTLFYECISGKQEAWNIFVERFTNLIYYSILRTLKKYNVFLEQPEVEEIYHSIFLSLMENNYRKLRQYKGKDQCTPASWIQIISRNHILNYIKAQKHHISLNDDQDKTAPLVNRIKDCKASVPEQIESAEAGRIIKSAIKELPSSDRMFMKLYYVKEFPPEEIAKIMNVSVNTIYSKKKRIPEKITNILNKKGIIARNSV